MKAIYTETSTTVEITSSIEMHYCNAKLLQDNTDKQSATCGGVVLLFNPICFNKKPKKGSISIDSNKVQTLSFIASVYKALPPDKYIRIYNATTLASASRDKINWANSPNTCADTQLSTDELPQNWWIAWGIDSSYSPIGEEVTINGILSLINERWNLLATLNAEGQSTSINEGINPKFCVSLGAKQHITITKGMHIHPQTINHHLGKDSDECIALKNQITNLITP